MSKKIVSLPSFNAVAAGQTATIELPANGTYHQLLLTYTTDTVGNENQVNMEAELTEFRLKVNGKVQRVFSAAQIFAINAFKGFPFATGLVPIFFAEPWRRAVQGEDVLAWGMGDVDTFQLEVVIDAGAINPTLKAIAVKTNDSPPMGPIVKMRRFTIGVSAIGIRNVTQLPKFDSYYALHAFSAVIDDVEVKIDQEEVFKATLAQVAEVEGWYGRTQQAGLFTVDFDYTNRAADALSMVKAGGGRVSDFRVDYNMNTATTFTLLTETLGLRD